jgi:hypothetical protein
VGICHGSWTRDLLPVRLTVLNLVKGSNNAGPIPPVRRIDSLGTDTTVCSTSTLDFNNRSETACREGLLDL